MNLRTFPGTKHGSRQHELLVCSADTPTVQLQEYCGSIAGVMWMVQGHAGEQTKNQKVRSMSAGETKEVDKNAKRHERSLRHAVTVGRQTGRDATGKKRPIEGRSISAG